MVIEVCSVQSCCDDKIDYSSVMINDMFSDFISFEHNKKYVLGFARTISYMWYNYLGCTAVCAQQVRYYEESFQWKMHF